MRVTNGATDSVVVCVDGGQGGEVEGTWSASLEWLVRRLAPRFPQLGFAEVRYRVKSWRRLELCVEDARAAVRAAGGARTLMLGFSMGGAVAIAAADEPAVERVVGLAPWIPDRLDVSPLRGKRLDVLHGSLDRYLPGIPGVYTLIPGALHAIALRAPGRREPVPLPRAARWAELVARELESFA